MRALLGMVMVIVAGCYSPSIAPALPCGAEGACPYDLVCEGGRCVTSASDLDAPGAPFDAPDGMPDALSPRWTETTSLPAPRNLACLVAHAGRLYHIGGSGSRSTTDALVAPILPSGLLGAWTPMAPLPLATRWHACAVDPVNAAIYVTGGDAGDVARTTVFRAAIQQDGALAAWTTEEALPFGRRGHGSLVHDGHLYVVAGEASAGYAVRANVYTIPVDANGTAGTWENTGNLGRTDYMFGTAVVGTRAYITGGYSGGADVVAATLGASGSFSMLTATTPLPEQRERHASVTDGTHVYVLGGEPDIDTVNLNSALRAAVQADGSLGPWTPLPTMPFAHAYLSAAYHDGRIYVAGGSDDAIASDRVVVLAPL